MIINTGARTDTVQYYTEWLLNRFKEGFVYVRNPLFENTITKYELTPEKVDLVLFCSKNYAPILPRLHEITDRFRTYFHYTVTAYQKDIEPGVPAIRDSIQTLIQLSAQVGKEKIAWRYDPVLLTEKYTIERHFETFEYIAQKVSPFIDRCIFSFVEMYKKLETNMPELIPLTQENKIRLAEGLGKIAQKHNIHIQTCGTNGDYSQYGVHGSGCATLEILGKANHCKFRELKHSGLRQGCHCIPSRDIGTYDTCLNGCKYCYANKNPQIAFQNFKRHDPNSPLLLGNITSRDIIQNGSQKSFLASIPGEQCVLELDKLLKPNH